MANEMPPVIADAIISCKVSGLIKEQAAELVEAWIKRFESTDRTHKIIAVESPWFEWLNKNTLSVGVKDLETESGLGEWKTHKAPRVRKDGAFYEGEGPEAWAKQMAASVQLSLYARKDANTNFLIRAAVKTVPPTFWEYQVTVTAESAQLARHCMVVEADMIRAARRHKAPWRFPDNHGRYGRQCPCGQDFQPPVETGGLIQPDDPGAAAVEDALKEHPERNTPDLVVLSASAYSQSVDCMEAYRRVLFGERETSEALDLGTAFHAGIGAFYRQLKGEQDGSKD